MIKSKDNALGVVKVLPSPFNGGGVPVCEPTDRAELRSWQAIGKPPVNSAFEQNPGSRASRPIPPTDRYFLGLDWFEATLRGQFVRIHPDDVERPLVNSAFPVPAGLRAGKVVLHHNQASRRNRHYRYGFDVLFIPAGGKESENRAAMVSSYKIGVLAAVPHSGNNCQPGTSILQLENDVLYRSDLWPTVDAVIGALGATVSHLTRLDLALDGFGLLNAADTYYRSDMAVKLGYAETETLAAVGKARFHVDRFEGGQVTNFYLGSMKSKKTLNGYTKGQRIDIENKQYIRSAWMAAGLIHREEDGIEVARLEMRHRKEALDELHLVNEETGEAEPFDWRRLRDARYLAGLYKETLRNFYGFKVVNPGDKDKSRWEDVPTINWDAFETAQVVRISRTRTPSETWKAKHSALKIIRDDSASDYLADAVRAELTSVPAYAVSTDVADELVQELETVAPELAPDQVRRIIERVAGKLSKDAVQYVTAWGADNVPCAMAWAMAEEHSITRYIEHRLQSDTGADLTKYGTVRLLNPQPAAATA